MTTYSESVVREMQARKIAQLQSLVELQAQNIEQLQVLLLKLSEIWQPVKK